MYRLAVWMKTNLSSEIYYQQPACINSSSSPFNLGQLKDIPPFMIPCANISSPIETLTEIAFSGVPYPKHCQTNELHGWFRGLPHYHQAFNDVVNNLPHEKAPYFSSENQEETDTANPGSRSAQKKFLVFDQSGDQTTLFYSPGVGPPVQLASEVRKPTNSCAINEIVKTDPFRHQEPILTYAYNEKQGNEIESEMHEDTEELNALLYSDDDYNGDEEEASTGHSPSTMTDFNKQWGMDGEEVASNFGPNKRIKLSNGGFEVSSFVGSANSADPKLFSVCEDDAKSSCGDGENLDMGDFGMSGGKERLRKDQIRETVSLLQSIIPSGKGKDKDVILIFDEAIDHLKSLKAKAQALGISDDLNLP